VIWASISLATMLDSRSQPARRVLATADRWLSRNSNVFCPQQRSNRPWQ
jgi:hypothetical protein